MGPLVPVTTKLHENKKFALFGHATPIPSLIVALVPLLGWRWHVVLTKKRTLHTVRDTNVAPAKELEAGHTARPGYAAGV